MHFFVYVGDTVQKIIDKAKKSNYITTDISASDICLMLKEGRKEGQQTFEELIRHAKPVPLGAIQ